MSKKKSYMNMKNILVEGWILDKLASIFLLPSNFDNYKEKRLKQFDDKITKIDKEISDLEKEFDRNQEEFFKAYEKSTGKKVKREPAKKAIKNMFDKRKGRR